MKKSPKTSEPRDQFIESVERLMAEHGVEMQMLRETNIQPAVPGQPTAKRLLKRSTIDRVFEKRTATLNIKRDLVLVLKLLTPFLAWDASVDVCVGWLNGGMLPKPPDREGPINEMRKALATLIGAASSPEGIIEAVKSYSTDDEKLRFWNVVNRLAAELNIQDFQSQLRAAGMPPGIPVPQNEFTLTLAGKIQNGGVPLTAPQRVVWMLAVKAYPPRPNGGAYPGLKDAARWLAKYWEYGVLEAAKAKCRKAGWAWDWNQMAPPFAGRKLEIWLLSWLELPLVMQTKDENQGKSNMFELGSYFQSMGTMP